MRLMGRHDCSHALRACAMALALVFFASASPAGAQDDKDIALTKDLVQSFIAAQKDLSDISAKLEKESEKPDEAVQAELEDVAKKHGFKSFDELDAVSTAVSNVMAGLDPDTGEFTNPKEAMQKELSDIKADKDIPAEEKKLLEEELTDAINNTPDTIPSENIEVVKSMRKEIEASMTVDGSASDGAAPSRRVIDTGRFQSASARLDAIAGVQGSGPLQLGPGRWMHRTGQFVLET